jgi:hypothetical protein
MTEGSISAGEVRFFSGSSNPQLAGKIAAYLGVPLEGTHTFNWEPVYAIAVCILCNRSPSRSTII